MATNNNLNGGPGSPENVHIQIEPEVELHAPASKEDLEKFLDSAARTSERFNLTQGFYTEDDVPGTSSRLEERELERHHRTGQFPHSYQPLKHRHGHHRHGHHHHHGHHKHKRKEDKVPSGDNSTKPDPSLSTEKPEEGAVVEPSVADRESSSDVPVITITDDSETQPLVTIETDTVDTPDVTLASSKDAETNDEHADELTSLTGGQEGVGFYVGDQDQASDAEISEAMRKNTSAPGELDEKATFFLGGEDDGTTDSPQRSQRGAPKSHYPLHKVRGSEVQLQDERHFTPAELNVEEREELGDADVDTIASHRYADTKAIRRRKISTHTLSSVVHVDRAEKKKLKVSKKRKKYDHSPHEMYVELGELYCSSHQDWTWKEKARWIKFEEDVEEGGGRWGKPHVASLSFHSLLELRKSIENGSVMLDLENEDIAGIVNEIVIELVSSGQLDEDNRDYVSKALLLKHRHVDGQSGFLRSLSHANLTNVVHSIQRRPSSPGLGLGDGSHDNAHGTQQDGFEKKRKGSLIPNLFKRRETKEIDPSEVELVSIEERKTSDHMKISVDEMKTEGRSGFANHYGPHLAIEEEEEQKASIQRSFSSGSALDITSESTPHIPHILKCIPKNSEATSVLVGDVDFLKKPVLCLVRLSEGRSLGNLTALPLPVRFIFVLLGPKKSGIDYHEIGRSISTLMSNARFRDMAYVADTKQDLLDAINEFLDESIVLPPGDWDKKLLLPVMDMAKKRALAKRKQKEREAAKAAAPVDKYGDPLKRTKRPFGGLLNDIKRRYPKYLSDLKDGLNMQCLATFFFIYFACLSPAITFGGLLGEKSDKYMGVSEMLIGVSVCGFIFHLFAGQPLLIIGATGPLLVFEEALYQICGSMGVDFIAFRCWCGFWVTAIAITIVGFEGSFLVRYFTRFVQEIFAFLISLIFIFEVFKKLYLIFQRHPLLPYYPAPPTTASPLDNTTDLDLTLSPVTLSFNISNNTDRTLDDEAMPIMNKPNTALLSVILTFGTFFIAHFLKNFRNSKFLGRSVRRALGDFGIPIAIVIMVTIDFLIKDTYTEKLDVPDGLKPTDIKKRGWVINPLGSEGQRLQVWHFFVAVVPALLVFILIFMESEITSTIVNKKDRKLKKGAGYHLDLIIIGTFATFSGIFGLPFLCAATVRSVTHVSALSVFSRTNAPGEKPQLEGVMEQRVTGLAVHVMIGVSVLMGPILRQVPLAVLFGVFLYMGIASMSGIQLLTRVELLFMPVKHHPNVSYVRRVRLVKLHLFTAIQLLFLAVLWAVKSTAAALAFPFILIILVPVRRFLLPKIFTTKELHELDKEEEDDGESDEDEPDFYTQAHMPQ